MTHRHSSFLTLSLAGLLGVSSILLAQEQPAPPRPAGDAPRDAAPPQERRPDVMGRVTNVSADGKTLTITMPPRPPESGQPPARDAKPEETTVTLTDQTQLLFFGVSDGQAQPTPGLMAMVWYAEGSNRAAKVRFMKREGDERPDIQGRVLSVAPDGRTITVELRDRDKVTGKTDLRLAPYTQALYYNVDKDGARPTANYDVVAWLEKGSKDTAARVRFMRPER
jgi:hypothetical protein